MAYNRSLTPVPPRNQLFESFNMISNMWYAWFNEVRNKVFPSPQKITGPQPINIDARYVDLKTNGEDYYITLEPPTIGGLDMTISMSAGGNTVTLDLANVVGTGGAGIAEFTEVNDTLVLKSISGKWFLVSSFGLILV